MQKLLCVIFSLACMAFGCISLSGCQSEVAKSATASMDQSSSDFLTKSLSDFDVR